MSDPGDVMTEAGERRADTTRHRLLAAASRQFANRPYSMVSLDDILAEAGLTKGAMYFHFSSKQALALAIIDDLAEMSRAAFTELLARKMSGLETLIDLAFLRAVQDAQYDVARAGIRLLESLDNPTPTPPNIWQSRAEFVTTIVRRAVADGDVTDQHDPGDIAAMLVALWVGVHRTSDFNHPDSYLNNLYQALTLALRSFTNPDRIEYFTQFARRRHELAVKIVCAEAIPVDLQVPAEA